MACDASLLWLKLDKSLGLHHDLYLCAAYVAPRHSSHYEREVSFDTFEQLLCDVADAQVLGDVLLAGDFNARNGQGADFVDQELQEQSPEGALPTGQSIHASPKISVRSLHLEGACLTCVVPLPC